MTTGLVDCTGAAIDNRKIAAFIDTLAGRTIVPEDAEYDTARRIWNASVDRHPGLIARCATPNDVVKAVNFARTNNILVAVRGGGHNVGGRRCATTASSSIFQ